MAFELANERVSPLAEMLVYETVAKLVFWRVVRKGTRSWNEVEPKVNTTLEGPSRALSSVRPGTTYFASERE